MSLPSTIDIDRPLPDEQRVRETLADRTLTKLGDDERLERLHRVFYPVFRVEYAYETGEGKLFGTERRKATALLDGLWADNDRALSQYADGAGDPRQLRTGGYDFGTDTPSLGRSVLLEFQGTTDDAASILPSRLTEFREQNAGTANVFLRKLREAYGLPADFDPDGFEGVQAVDRLYLPFWLAEFHAPHSEAVVMVSLRDPDADTDELRRHAWLAEYVSADPGGWRPTATRSTPTASNATSASGSTSPTARTNRSSTVGAATERTNLTALRRSTVSVPPTRTPSSSPTASRWTPSRSSSPTPSGASPMSAG
ncbi:hypothetical protein ACFQL1_05370 [Halomicroarcula sp. GCM10025709]